jgi:hypothetical protein
MGYFKTAWRNMTRNKLTGFINVFGLAIGLSCSLLIWLWVSDELSYYSFLPGVKIFMRCMSMRLLMAIQ